MSRHLQHRWCFLLLFAPLTAQLDYPQFSLAERRNAVFAQLQQEIQLNRKHAARHQPLLPLQFYRYCGPASSLISLAAMLGLPYEALATINGWQHFSDFSTQECLWVPNMPGVAVPISNRNRWQQSLFEQREKDQAQQLMLEGQSWLFFPFSLFSRRERLLFLTTPFAMPLASKLHVTSHYGWRENPFGGGQKELHRGLDLRSPVGTTVYSAAAGKVSAIGHDPTYGLYLQVDHGRGLLTLYGHLSKVVRQKGDQVVAGQQLALSGQSGRVNGPHLHFGVYRNGHSIDPSSYLGLKAWEREASSTSFPP